jgi:3-hydroxyisobutyrate dehydrogenase-like beta-hydroxyacid dehydrogenase
MREITLIGLGTMGSALARALIGAGHKVTLWNGTRAKMEPFLAQGAKGAADLPSALEASPILLTCIDNYDVTRDLLGGEALLSRLAGRTLIQLSTGTPEEARASEAWLKPRGVTYIDGAIMPYPSGIGQEDAQILFAGPEQAFRESKPYLDCLGGDLRYLGEKIAAAATLDMALLTVELGKYVGALHGALLCSAEGVGLDVFASMFPQGEPARAFIELLASEAFDNPNCTLTVWLAALQRIQDQARNVGINSEIPDFYTALFKRAIAAGHGEQDLAATIKILRRDSPVS